MAKKRLPRVLWAGAGLAGLVGALETLQGVWWAPLLAGAALMGTGGLCVLNAARSGRVHCTFTGPLFLGLGGLTLLNAVWLFLPWLILWLLLCAGTLVAFVPEIRGRVYWNVPRRE